MSGHSKWSKVKHQKESTDAVKGKIFTKMANAIIIAVKSGGGNPDPVSNFKLRLAMEKARRVNMPKEKIEKAIARGQGKSEGENYNEVVYEAFGPGGVGIIIEATTDNKQRTVAEIKNILDHSDGVLASSGAVVHSFQFVGVISVSKNGKSFDDLMNLAIETGALDIEDDGEMCEIYTDPSQIHKVKEELEERAVHISSFELVYRPITQVAINDKATANKLLNLLTQLEENECVQKVFSNFDIPDEFISYI